MCLVAVSPLSAFDMVKSICLCFLTQAVPPSLSQSQLKAALHPSRVHKHLLVTQDQILPHGSTHTSPQQSFSPQQLLKHYKTSGGHSQSAQGLRSCAVRSVQSYSLVLLTAKAIFTRLYSQTDCCLSSQIISNSRGVRRKTAFVSLIVI